MTGVLPLTIVSGAQRELASGDYLANPEYSGYISGLQLIWNSATSISIGPGTAELESTGRLLKNPSTFTLSSLSLSASTEYYVYLYSFLGSAIFEVSSTAPASPYSGTARSKTSDTAKRYVGWLITDASGNIRPFIHNKNSGFVGFLLTKDAGSQWTRILNGGTATTATNVDCSAIIPPGCREINAFLINTGTQQAILSDGDRSLDANNQQTYVNAGLRYPYPLILSSSGAFKYLVTSGGVLYVDVNSAHMPR